MPAAPSSLTDPAIGQLLIAAQALSLQMLGLHCELQQLYLLRVRRWQATQVILTGGSAYCHQ